MTLVDTVTVWMIYFRFTLYYYANLPILLWGLSLDISHSR